MPSRLLRLLALALLVCACDDAPTVRGWERVDLWQREPRVLRSGPRGDVEPVLALHGPPEVRDAATLTPRDLQRVPQLLPPRLRALRQLAGSTIAWRLALGETPSLSFVALPATSPCGARGTVRVAAGEATPEEVWSGAPPPPGLPVPAEVRVDLARWANSEVDLELSVEADPSASACSFDWGAPEVVAVGAVATQPGADGPPNILLLGADTLRADALGAWGRQPSLTPALDALAAESDVWTHAFSTVNATNQSFASIHTGLYVHHHGVRDLETPLPAEHVTLAERLGEAGYATHAILAAQHLGPHNSGLDQGFDQLVPAENTSSARLVVDSAMQWLEARERQKPFFLWLHFFDPHTPHTPPAPYALGERHDASYGLGPVLGWSPFRTLGARSFRETRLGGESDLYAGEVAYLDRQIDRLLGFLRERGMLQNTLVVFVADHGENLEDHGVRYRHAGLWDTTTHVPMMIRWPGDRPAGRRVDSLVQTIDLYPTLLGAAGLRPNAQDGQDLRSASRGRRAVFADQADGEGGAVRTRTFRYFESVGSKLVPAGSYLYDLAADPGELVNLAGSGRSEEAELRALLQRWRATATARPVVEQRTLSPEDEAELRALGYL
jgi:arylsulfatase